MNKKFEHLRKNYTANTLEESNTPDAPIELFMRWFDEVSDVGGVDEVNAMTLSTVNSDGNVQGRVVLLKGNIDDSFVFYTNYESDKCKALFAHPRVSLSFFWPNLERQVLISGVAQKTTAAVSDAYFASRPRGSQLGAHVSPQSKAINSRTVLEERLEVLTQKFEGKDIPRPEHWGGVAVHPQRIEFWQGRPNRLHDRIVYTKSEDDTWTRQRLAP
jgi:pyridoxamine 5'-phosphate oxidase